MFSKLYMILNWLHWDTPTLEYISKSFPNNFFSPKWNWWKQFLTFWEIFEVFCLEKSCLGVNALFLYKQIVQATLRAYWFHQQLPFKHRFKPMGKILTKFLKKRFLRNLKKLHTAKLKLIFSRYILKIHQQVNLTLQIY